MYAKLNEKGYPELLTKHYIKEKGRLILNPSENRLRELGYKPLKKGEPPACREGDILAISYIDTGDFIEEIYSILEV